ncbi:MAG: hypothetical protein EBS42_11185, partial [Caulobacteraceae bacterium]|nr:hypothetical protein [Caulobacteraceae bacterium]
FAPLVDSFFLKLIVLLISPFGARGAWVAAENATHAWFATPPPRPGVGTGQRWFEQGVSRRRDLPMNLSALGKNLLQGDAQAPPLETSFSALPEGFPREAVECRASAHRPHADGDATPSRE